MTEKEAAQLLSLSVRTLRNYRHEGKLSFREVKGKTRPVIEYERAEVERLKAELDRRRQRSRKPAPSPLQAPPRVTFGLPPAEFEELAAEARKYGLSAGEYARRLAREGLENRFREEAVELRTENQKLNAEIRRLRNDVSAAFEALLEFMQVSPEVAKQWADDNIR